MNFFKYVRGKLYCEGVSLESIAQRFGTPCYIYSYNTLVRHYRRIKSSWRPLDPIIAYSIKANSNLAVLKTFARLGSWADAVSAGEIFRALKAGFPSSRIIFGAVGKNEAEIKYALQQNIFMLIIDSASEMRMVNQLADRLKHKINVAFRINPDINPRTHPHIATGLKKNKFGIDMKQAWDVYQAARQLKHLRVIGIHQHIGSQIIRIGPFRDALRKIVTLAEKLNRNGFDIRYIDMGGGIGITYKHEKPFSLEDLSRQIKPVIKPLNAQLILEPGRVIVGNAGVLLARVVHTKKVVRKNFVITDAGMHNLIRPVLYGAYHEIKSVRKKPNKIIADVVGPICESGDFLAQDRYIPDFGKDELIAVMGAGAYGFSMASNYNSRTRPVEIMVRGRKVYRIRKRETMNDLIKGESIPSFLRSSR